MGTYNVHALCRKSANVEEDTYGGVVDLMYIEVSPEQFTKQYFPILVTDEGMVIEVKLEQL